MFKSSQKALILLQLQKQNKEEAYKSIGDFEDIDDLEYIGSEIPEILFEYRVPWFFVCFLMNAFLSKIYDLSNM